VLCNRASPRRFRTCNRPRKTCSSRSRIVDTDFAAETASLTRGQILQQAGTAMLAQANSLPNGVLSLLRG
jgi:flagellin-like hook-associated protein FlgL